MHKNGRDDRRLLRSGERSIHAPRIGHKCLIHDHVLEDHRYAGRLDEQDDTVLMVTLPFALGDIQVPSME